MEQSEEYENNTIIFDKEDSLVDYLKYKILNDYIYCKSFDKIKTTKEKIKEEDFKLEINDYSGKIIINFDFLFYNILKKLHDINDDEKTNQIIINYVIYFSNVDFNCRTTFDNIIFKNKLLFLNVNFNNNVTFNNSEFYYLYISSCISKDYFNFKNIHINKMLRIILSEYNQNNSISFNDLNFINYNSILYINGNSNKLKEIKITDSIINGKINLIGIEVEKANFIYSNINSGIFYTVNFKVHEFANRESALFLKNEAYARNNAIDALQYKAQEVELHKDELIKKSNKTYKDWADIFSIGLSSLYSDNGQNWIKALFMTIFITALCFTVFYIPDLTDSNIIRIYYRNLFPELIKYFIPTDYSLIIKYAASKLNLFLKIFGVLVYFLGKILFWYGSVQTVQAFRKFAKGA